jgi:hypothetical protein
MKTVRMKNKFLLIIACFVGSASFAQTPLGLGDETVFTFGNRMLTVGDAFKINVSPRIYDSIVTIEEPMYLFMPKKVKTAYQVKAILPARLRIMEPLGELQKVYVKAGLGLHNTSLIQVSMNQLRSKKSQIGLTFDHLASNGGVNDVISSQFSNNGLTLWGKYLSKKRQVETKLSYNRFARHFYGYPITIEPLAVEKDIAQLVNRIGGNVALRSILADSSKVQYATEIDFSHVSDQYKANETRIQLNNTFGKLHQKEWYKLDFNIDYNQLKSVDLRDTTNVTQNNAILEVTPQIISTGKRIKIQVGLSIQGDMYKTAKFHFFPKAEISYSMFRSMFIPYAGLKGGIIRNNWGNAFAENPFVSSHIDLQNTNEKLVAYAGIKGSLSKSTSFNINLTNKKVENMALFVNDTIASAGNKYTLIYDDGRILNVSAELNYHKGINTELYIKGDWYDYGFSNEGAWNLPIYKIGVGSRFKIQDKFKLGTEIYYIGDREAKALTPAALNTTDIAEVQKLKGFFDVNLDVEYRYTKRISAFIQLNNLANTSYQRWYKYQSMPLTVLGGLTYSF